MHVYVRKLDQGLPTWSPFLHRHVRSGRLSLPEDRARVFRWNLNVNVKKPARIPRCRWMEEWRYCEDGENMGNQQPDQPPLVIKHQVVSSSIKLLPRSPGRRSFWALEPSLPMCQIVFHLGKPGAKPATPHHLHPFSSSQQNEWFRFYHDESWSFHRNEWGKKNRQFGCLEKLPGNLTTATIWMYVMGGTRKSFVKWREGEETFRISGLERWKLEPPMVVIPPPNHQAMITLP